MAARPRYSRTSIAKGETMPTASQELSEQIVFDLFSQGIPITDVDRDIAYRKSNATINVISKLGLLELKILDACMFIAKGHTKDNLFSVPIEYLKWLIDFNSKNHRYLEKGFTNIQQALLQLNVVDSVNPTKDDFRSTVFIYDVALSQGNVYFRIPESILITMANPRSWTYLSLRIKNKFSSEYAYRLYERCRSEQFRHGTDWWTMDEFREIMNVVDSYSIFQDLYKRVIKPSVEQINTVSDIYVQDEYKAVGRSKTHIRFTIKDNPGLLAGREMNLKERLLPEIYNVLKTEFSLSNSEVDEVCSYSIDSIKEKIEFARYRIKIAKPAINKPNKYLLTALREDLRLNPSELAAIERERARKTKLLAATSPNSIKDAEDARNKVIYALYEAMDKTEQDRLYDQFKETKEFEQLKKVWKGKVEMGLSKPPILVAFIHFLKLNGVFPPDGV